MDYESKHDENHCKDCGEYKCNCKCASRNSEALQQQRNIANQSARLDEIVQLLKEIRDKMPISFQ